MHDFQTHQRTLLFPHNSAGRLNLKDPLSAVVYLPLCDSLTGRREVVRAMFSGIVEEMGHVSSLIKNDKVKLWDGSEGAGVELTVKAKTVLDGATEGCSIAVNGVCLTVTSFDSEEFKVQFTSVHSSQFIAVPVRKKHQGLTAEGCLGVVESVFFQG